MEYIHGSSPNPCTRTRPLFEEKKNVCNFNAKFMCFERKIIFKMEIMAREMQSTHTQVSEGEPPASAHIILCTIV